VTIVIEVIAVLFSFNINVLAVVGVLKPGYNLSDLCGSSYFETAVPLILLEMNRMKTVHYANYAVTETAKY
jgi:hypothetical protein